MLKTLYNNLPPCLSVLSFFAILSCDISEPNETYYNHDAKPPEQLALNIQELRPGEYVAGRIVFNFYPAVPSQDIKNVVFAVDDNIASTAYGAPYQFDVDTRLWPEGPHVLSVGIVKNSSPDLGLLNFFGAPSTVYFASVVFDQRPPSAVVLDSVGWNNASRSPFLSWRRSNDSNFYAYIISKDGNFGPVNPNIVGEGIDSVFDRAATSYLDNSIHQIYGLKLWYQINVTNRDAIAPSNIDTIHFGQTLPVSPGTNVGYIVRPIQSTLRDEMYVLESEGVKAVSTLDNTVTRSFNLGNYPLNFAMSKDNSKLYIVTTYSPTLIVLDASDFSVVLTTNLSFNASSIICGRADRLYLTTSYPFDGPVKILDANTGAEIGNLGVNAPGGLLAISSDNNTLYVARTFGPATLYKIDISSDSAQVLTQRSVANPDEVRLMQLSPDDQKVFIVIGDINYPPPLNQFVDIWDASTLANASRINTPDYVFDFVATNTSIYISYGMPGGRYFEAGRVVEYDLASHTPHGSWDFVQVPRANQVSRDKHFLYSFGFESWIVPLQP